MILVDSSVLIKALGGKTDNLRVAELDRIIAADIPFAICPYVYQEVLQGVADDLAFHKTKRYLETQEFLWLPGEVATFERAARLFWDLRRNGVTLRSTMDVLIALTAIEHGAFLLHDDPDFDRIAEFDDRLLIANGRY